MSQAGVVAGGRLTGWISLDVLTSWVPADAVEGGNAQFKAFLRGPGKVLRPESLEMIEREIRGCLLTRYAVSALIRAAAASAGIDPDRREVPAPSRDVRSHRPTRLAD